MSLSEDLKSLQSEIHETLYSAGWDGKVVVSQKGTSKDELCKFVHKITEIIEGSVESFPSCAIGTQANLDEFWLEKAIEEAELREEEVEIQVSAHLGGKPFWMRFTVKPGKIVTTEDMIEAALAHAKETLKEYK